MVGGQGSLRTVVESKAQYCCAPMLAQGVSNLHPPVANLRDSFSQPQT
jgi:hypothetical protein